MTFEEYRLLMEAAQLRQIDMDYRNHLQAWLTFSAQATDRKGKPIYKKFNKFYDYEEQLDSTKGEKKSKLSGLYKFLKSRE